MKADFSKGIHTNSKPVNTPEGSYRSAENMRVSGNAKRTDEGNTQTNVPIKFIQWGSCSIGTQTILLGTIDGTSVIGSLDISGVWLIEIAGRTPDILGFTGPVQVEGRKNWAGERLIYFSTEQGSRRINLDTINKPTIPSNAEFDKLTSLFLEYDLPRVMYTGEEVTGTLMSGVYQLAAR